MNTKTLPLSLSRTAQTRSKATIVSFSGVLTTLNTIVSTVLTLFMAIFFVWVNGRQHEFDELKDSSR